MVFELTGLGWYNLQTSTMATLGKSILLPTKITLISCNLTPLRHTKGETCGTQDCRPNGRKSLHAFGL